MLQLAGESERGDIELVERREGLPAGDLRAAAAVQLVGAIMRASAEQYFKPDPGGSEPADDLATLVHRRLEVVRELF